MDKEEQRRADRRHTLASLARAPAPGVGIGFDSTETPARTPADLQSIARTWREAAYDCPRPLFAYDGAATLSTARARQVVDATSRRIDEVIRRDADCETRAAELLHRYLTARQRKTLDDSGYFDVPSRERPGCVYRIRRAWVINIEVIGGPATGLGMMLCGAPDGVPLSDMMLAQKLWLEADEKGFLARSHIHFTRGLRIGGDDV